MLLSALSYFVKGIYHGVSIGRHCEGDGTALYEATRDFAKAESRYLKSYRRYGYDEHDEVSCNKDLLKSTRRNYIRLYNEQPESARRAMSKLERDMLNMYIRY